MLEHRLQLHCYLRNGATLLPQLHLLYSYLIYSICSSLPKIGLSPCMGYVANRWGIQTEDSNMRSLDRTIYILWYLHQWTTGHKITWSSIYLSCLTMSESCFTQLNDTNSHLHYWHGCPNIALGRYTRGKAHISHALLLDQFTCLFCLYGYSGTIAYTIGPGVCVGVCTMCCLWSGDSLESGVLLCAEMLWEKEKNPQLTAAKTETETMPRNNQLFLSPLMTLKPTTLTQT